MNARLQSHTIRTWATRVTLGAVLLGSGAANAQGAGKATPGATKPAPAKPAQPSASAKGSEQDAKTKALLERRALVMSLTPLKAQALQAQTGATEAKREVETLIPTVDASLAKLDKAFRENTTTWKAINTRLAAASAAQKKPGSKPMTMDALGQLETSLRADAPIMMGDVTDAGDADSAPQLTAAGTGRSVIEQANDAAKKADAAATKLKGLAGKDKQAKLPPDAQVAKALLVAEEVKASAAATQREVAAMTKQIKAANAGRLQKQRQLITLKASFEAENRKFSKAWDELYQRVEAESKKNGTPPEILTAAALQSALPSGTVAMSPKEIAPEFAGYPFALFEKKNTPFALALARLDPSFAAEITGPASENTALRLADKRGLLIVEGCGTAHACNTTSYVLVYDATNKQAGLVSQTETPAQFSKRSALDATANSVLLNVARKSLTQ